MTPAPRETWRPEVRHVGTTVLFFDELESTQATARTYPAGTVIIANHQTGGRGQYGRTWTSRPGSGLLLSAVLDPPAELRRAVVLTAWAAVAVGEAVRQLIGHPPRIKWPNDLLLKGKKVCGILTELGHTLVCGIGLNVTQTADELKAEGLPDATSLSAESGRPLSVRKVAETVVPALDMAYDRLLAGAVSELEADWVARSGLLGRTVTAELADRTSVTGRVQSLGFAGIELAEGDGTDRILVPEFVRQLRPV